MWRRLYGTISRYILLLTRAGWAGPYTYLRLKVPENRLVLFPGCQNSGTLCLNSVADAVRGI